MPHINELKEGKYLKKEDLPRPAIATIVDCQMENVAMQGQPPEQKWILHFQEEDLKPLILNSTNIQLAAAATGCDVTEEWPGKKIVVYADPTVAYKGKITGGVRIRAMRNQTAAPVAATAATRPAPAARPAQPPPSQMAEPPDPDDTDVPF